MDSHRTSRARRRVRTYHDLDVWRHAVEVFVLVTRIVRSLPLSERLVFETQTRRAARGVAASIAEGFRRRDLGDYVRSLSYASGSLGEVGTDLHLIARVNDVDGDQLTQCLALADRTGRELTSLTNVLRQRWLDAKRRSPAKSEDTNRHRRPTT